MIYLNGIFIYNINIIHIFVKYFIFIYEAGQIIIRIWSRSIDKKIRLLILKYTSILIISLNMNHPKDTVVYLMDTQNEFQQQQRTIII